MNRIRFFTSGLLFLFSVGCLIWNPELPFTLPRWMTAAGTIYFAVFPIKDMLSALSRSRYKGRQFAKNYEPEPLLDRQAFEREKRRYDRRAVGALAFWLCFLFVVAGLYWGGIIGRAWIFFFFALSNFSVFFAIFFWCPFQAVLVRPSCCMECRIFNWDSFFAYSFLILLPNPMTILLFSLGVLSLVEWEIMHARHPERFYKSSNRSLRCENCDLEACKQGKKKRFHTKLREGCMQEEGTGCNPCASKEANVLGK